MSRSKAMPKSEHFEAPKKQNQESAPAKDASAGPALQRIPRAGAFIFTDGKTFYYHRPQQDREKFDTIAQVRKHEAQDLKKNPLNWKQSLLTR